MLDHKEQISGQSPEQDQGKEKLILSRRKLLASLGIAGVALASSGFIGGALSKVSADPIMMDSVQSTTIAELRGLTTADANLVYFVRDLGKEGSFYYDPSDTSSTDNLGTTVVSTTGLRFKRLVTGSIHATWFGVTAGVAEDQSLKIQQAVDYCHSQGGGVVRLPPGQIWISVENNRVLGTGIEMKDRVFLDMTGADLLAFPTTLTGYGMIFFFDHVHHAGVVGGRIFGERNGHIGSTGESGMGIRLQGAKHILLRDISIHDCWGDGIFVGNGFADTSIKSEYVMIENIVCLNNRRQGISVTHADNIWIDKAVCKGTNGTSPAAGIDIEPDAGHQASNIYVTNCTLDDNEGAGLLTFAANGITDPLTAPDIINLFISNCSVDNNNGGGISLNYVKHCTVSGVSATNNTNGGLLVSTSSFVNLSDLFLQNNNNQQTYHRGDISLFNCAHIHLLNASVESSLAKAALLIRGTKEVSVGNVSILNSVLPEVSVIVEVNSTNVLFQNLRVNNTKNSALYVDQDVQGFSAENINLIDCAYFPGSSTAADIQSENFIIVGMRCTSSKGSKPTYCINTPAAKFILTNSVLTGYSTSAIKTWTTGTAFVIANNLT